jgi:hypothetical protein
MIPGVTPIETLPAVECIGCGASLPVHPEQPEVVCTHCGATRAVPPELRERAARHLRALRDAWSDALEARWAEVVHRQGARATPALIRWTIPGALLVPFWIMGTGTLGGQSWLLVAALLLLTLGVWWRWTSIFIAVIGQPSVGLVLGSGLGACGACGAPVVVPEGEVRTECGYCRAVVVTTPAIRRGLLDGALARAKSIGSEREVAEAASWQVVEDARATFGVRGNTVMVTVVLLVGGAIAMALTLGHAEPTPAGWVCPIVVVATSIIVVRLAVAIRRIQREVAAFGKLIGRKPSLTAPGARGASSA